MTRKPGRAHSPSREAGALQSSGSRHRESRLAEAPRNKSEGDVPFAVASRNCAVTAATSAQVRCVAQVALRLVDKDTDLRTIQLGRTALGCSLPAKNVACYVGDC